MSDGRSVTVTAQRDAERRAQTRQQLLAATRELLAGGEALAKLSIQRIVTEVGISRATFYLHFRSKKELMAALAASETAEWAEIAGPVLLDTSAGKEQVAQAVTGILALWRKHRGVLAGIIEMAEYDEEARQAWRETIWGIARVIGEALRARRPTLSAAEAEQLGRLLAWAGERYLHQEVGEEVLQHDALLVGSFTELVWKLMRD